MSSPVVTRGRLLSYRIFDAANEIALSVAERRLAAAKVHRRVRLGREGAAEVMIFKERPLEIGLGKRKVRFPKRDVELEATLVARAFEYGAVSILFEFPIEPGTSLESLTELCAELYEAPVLEEMGRAEMESLLGELGDAVASPHIWNSVETYTVVFVQELEGKPKIEALRTSQDIAKLLTGETSPKALNDDERKDVLGAALSYFEDDLVVIDWNSAFVLEPSGSREIPDILEFATSQLLEHRYYDSLLDAELDRIYDEIAKLRKRWIILRSPYASLARDVLGRLVELWEFTERVDNALKVIGDFYLARVYQAAVKRFRIPSWQTSLSEKQSLIRHAYDLLKGDVDIQRSVVLEIVVIVLIAVELVRSLWH